MKKETDTINLILFSRYGKIFSYQLKASLLKMSLIGIISLAAMSLFVNSNYYSLHKNYKKLQSENLNSKGIIFQYKSKYENLFERIYSG